MNRRRLCSKDTTVGATACSLSPELRLPQIVEHLRFGVILADGAAHPLDRNACAAEMLARGQGLVPTPSGLAGEWRRATGALRGLIRRAAHARARRARAIGLACADGRRPLTAVVVPAALDAVESAALLFVADLDRPASWPPASLTGLYDLTPTEAQLAAYLIRRGSTTEAAESLGISAGTVRVHLKHMFSKTGTHSQVELVALLARSPAMLAPCLAGLEAQARGTGVDGPVLAQLERVVLDHLPLPTFELDERARVRTLNDRAGRLLQRGYGLKVQDERLRIEEPRAERELQWAMAQGVTVNIDASMPARRRGSRGAPRALRVIPRAPRGKALLVADQPAQRPRPAQAMLAEMFELSPTEARVATDLTSGLPLEEVVERLGIGIGTVRTHLRRIFDKTGTRRQAELVALLAATPAALAVSGAEHKRASGVSHMVDARALGPT